MPTRNSLTLLIAAALCACGSTEADDRNANTGAGGASGAAGTGGSSATGAANSGGNTSGGATGGGATSGGSGGADGGSAGSALGGASMGGGSGGAPTDGGAGTGPTGVVGIVGTGCSSPGALACAGNYQKLTVVCGGDGTWQPNQTCGTGEFCDSTSGPNAGTCQPQLPECVAGPGTRFCSDRMTAVECGPDALSTTIETCNCWVGACVPEGMDPCPDPADFTSVASCAADCGVVACSAEACAGNESAITDFPAVYRATHEQLRESCPCPDSVFRPNLVQVTPQARRVRVSVLPPWRIGNFRYSFEEGYVCAATTQCLIFTPGVNAVVSVVSDDPQALPRNVLFEEVEPGVECP